MIGHLPHKRLISSMLWVQIESSDGASRVHVSLHMHTYANWLARTLTHAHNSCYTNTHLLKNDAPPPQLTLRDLPLTHGCEGGGRKDGKKEIEAKLSRRPRLSLNCCHRNKNTILVPYRYRIPARAERT